MKNVYKWIGLEAKKLNLNLDPNPKKISSNIGLNLEMIKKALEKNYRSFQTMGNLITIDEIEKYIGFSKEYNSFELQKSIGEKKFDKSIFIINQMFQKAIDNRKNKYHFVLLHNFFKKIIFNA